MDKLPSRIVFQISAMTSQSDSMVEFGLGAVYSEWELVLLIMLFVVTNVDALDSSIIESLKVEKASKDRKNANAFSTVGGGFGTWGGASATKKTPAISVGKDPCKGGAMLVG